MKEYQSLSHTRWDCKYHIVFIPKRRKKAIFGALRKQLGEVLRELARHKESEVVEGHLRPDHVHMCISIPPKIAVSNVVGYIKGKSAITIARKFMGRARNFTGGGVLGTRVFRVHGGTRRGNGSSVHPPSGNRGRALRPDKPRSVSRLQAAHGVIAPLRRSPNKPPALPGVI